MISDGLWVKLEVNDASDIERTVIQQIQKEI